MPLTDIKKAKEVKLATPIGFCDYCKTNPNVFPYRGDKPDNTTSYKSYVIKDKIGVHFCPIERCINSIKNVDIKKLDVTKLHIIR